MNVRISIVSAALREIPYTDKKGAPQRLLVQTAYLHSVDAEGTVAPYPDKFEVVLPKGQTLPFNPGDYTLHPSAVYVDQRGRLACTPRLTPIRPAAKTA
jgi:hypothetical protein